jgi:dUTP pyrophosphatase
MGCPSLQSRRRNPQPVRERVGMSLPCVVEDRGLLPVRKTVGSAGLDLFCAVQPEVVLKPGVVTRVSAGTRVAIPLGHYGKVEDRSSLASTGVIVVAGIIDSDYRGVVEVALLNVGSGTSVISYGSRMAQLIVQPYASLTPTLVDDLGVTERGAGGFGSTGR